MAAPERPGGPRTTVLPLEPRDYLDLLTQYTRELAQTLEVARIYEIALDGSLRLSGAPAGLICGQDPDTGFWQPLATRGLDAAQTAAFCQGLATGHPVLPPLLSIPLAFDADTSSMLHLLITPGAVPADQLAAVRLLLEQAGTTARNSGLCLQAVSWAQRVARLQTVGAEIGASLDLPAVLDAAVGWAIDLVDGSSGVLALWNVQTRLLRVETRARGVGVLDTGHRVAALGEGLAGRVAETRRPIALRDYQQWEHAVPTAAGPPLHALVAVPLLWQDELLGVLEVGDYQPGHVFLPEDMSLLMLLAQQTAGAMANARLYTHAQQRLHQLTVLQDTSRAIIAQLDYDQVLQTVLHSACDLFGTHMGAVFVVDEQQGLATARTAVGLSEAFLRGDDALHGEAGVARVLATAKPVAIYDVQTDPLLAPTVPGVRPVEFRSMLAVPLIHQGQVLGALCIYGATPRHWSPAQAELLLVFASQAASAMQNTLLFERLRAEKATLATTIQSMSDGVVVTDATGAVILANPIADQMFHVPYTTSLGESLPAVLHAGPYALAFRGGDPGPRLLDMVLGEGRPYRGELTIRRPEPLTLEFNFLPVIGAGYIITGGVALFHDITELHRLNEMKTDFISMVSHELRTPLTSIKGFVKLVLVGELGPLTTRQRESLEVADRESDRLRHLINDLLDISRIDAGRIVFKWEALALADLLRGVLEAMAPQAEERKLALVADVPESLPLVRGDRQRTAQILTNLLGNAIKFTPPGGRVSVSVRPEAGAVAIRVADTGEGIPLYAQKHIFDRFYQVEPGSNRSRGGTGLGLSIAKQLVELQGGRIGVQSAPGAGTTITFTLQPVEALPPEGAAAPIPAAPAPAEPE